MTVLATTPRAAGTRLVREQPGTDGTRLLACLTSCAELVLDAVRRVAEDTWPVPPEKVRCEAAMLLRALAPWSGRPGRLAVLARELADELEATRDDTLLVALALDPGRALDRSLVHLHLRAAGRPDARVDAMLGDLLGPGRLRGPEREPHRELEQLWLESLWTGRWRTAAVDALVRRSALARPLDVLAATTDDLYALTHVVLYATDHGRHRLAVPRGQEALAADVDAALAVALDAENLDLVAELLWSWPMAALPWSPGAQLAWRTLQRVHAVHGYLPGPGVDPAAAGRDATLPASYHTTLVLGLLCAAMLHRAARPPGATAPTRTGTYDAVRAALPPAGRPRTWPHVAAGLQPAQRDALAPALLAIGLRRAHDAADVHALRGLLSVAAEHDLLDAPAPRQGLALLRRAALLAGRLQESVRPGLPSVREHVGERRDRPRGPRGSGQAAGRVRTRR